MSVGRTGCTLVVLGQSSHEVALRAALEPPHGHRKYIYFDFDSPLVYVDFCNLLLELQKPPAPVALQGRLCRSAKPHEFKRSLVDRVAV